MVNKIPHLVKIIEERGGKTFETDAAGRFL
jgi:hypothetical protein